MVLKAPVPQRWEGPDDVTSGEGTFKQTQKEGWDCWVSHSRALGIDSKSMGSAWPCGFLSGHRSPQPGGAGGCTVFATALFSLG